MYKKCSTHLARLLMIWAFPLALLVAMAGCNGEPDTEAEAEPEEEPYQQTLTDLEEEEGFVHLFDGTNLDAWRGFQQDDVPSGWIIDDEGALLVDGEADTDLITRDTYSNFDLRMDFWVPEGANSGIFYMVAENDYEEAWHTGPEYQILDDHSAEDSAPEQLTATNYSLQATDFDAFAATDTWQTARIVKDGNNVQHWLNDDLVVSYEIGDPEWEQQLSESGFADFDGYAQYDDGHLGLQHYGDEVRFGNVRVHSW